MPKVTRNTNATEKVEIIGRNSNCRLCGLGKCHKDSAEEVCVWGTGNPNASIMFIGEVPGKDDGEIKKLLVKYLEIVGLDEKNLYFSHTVKCKPEQNKLPKPGELKSCAPYLDYEIATIRPKVIGLLGNVALKRMTGSDGISQMRGKPIWSDKYNCWCVPTWHPAFIRRNNEAFTETEQFKRDLTFMKKIAETGDTGQLKTEYKLIDNLNLFNGMLINLQASKVASVDTETFGDYLTGKILLVQLSTKVGTAFVVPFYKTGPEYDKPTDKVWSEEEEKYIWPKLKEYLENPELKKVGQNIKYDYQFFKLYGITLRGVIYDTMLAHYLLDENAKGQHGLDTLSLRFTDMGDYSADLYNTLGIKYSDVNETTFIKAPFESFWKYAAKDADCTMRVFCATYEMVKNQSLLFLLQKVMIPLSFALADMEINGVLVDVEYYKILAVEYQSKIDEIEKQLLAFPDVQLLKERLGKEVNFNSCDQMRVLFYDMLKLPVLKQTRNKKKKTNSDSKPSVDKESLEKLAPLHPVASVLAKHRKFKKFLSTYISPIPELVKSDGRLHTSYMQHVTVTGRLASSKPNLQNIPKKEPDMAAQIRHGIMAPEGYTLLEVDYAQIEFRLLANESKDEKMLADIADTKVDIHKKIASIAFKMPIEKVTSELREKAKTIVYSVIYGKSEENLAKQTGLSVEQVKAIFEALFSRYPAAKEWMRRIANHAQTAGEVTNWIGRKRRLANGFKSGIEPLMAEARRQAVNAPIQGGAHDILSVATLRVRAELKKNNLKSRLVMNIHDALILEVANEETEIVVKLVKECMERPMPRIVVPLIAEIKLGKRLDEVKKMEA